jgi:hypothetical protein
MSARLAEGNQSRSIGIYPTRQLLEDVGFDLSEGKNTIFNLDVLEGIGDDVGFWMLVPDPKGYAITLSKPKAHTCSCSISISKLKHYVLNECPVPPTEVEYSIDAKEHSILVQLPDWLRFNPLSVSEEVVKQAKETPYERLQLNRVERRRIGKAVSKAL